MRILILWFILIISGVHTSVYAQWTPIQTGIPGSMADLYFTNAQTGFIVGDRGIYRSTDAGMNWLPASFQAGSAEQAIYSRTSFRAVFFCPSICNKGYAVGQDTLLQQGVCFETGDQGLSWQIFQPVANPPASWNDLVIVNNTIFMGGDQGRFVIKHPFNPNWTEATTSPLGDIRSVWFSGASPGGLTATSQGLYYSADVGANWAKVIDGTMAGAVAGFSKGFAAGNYQLFRATPPNAVSLWAPVFEFPDSAQTSCLALRGFSVEDVSLGGANGVYKRIADEVWEWQPSSQGYPVHALFFLNNQTGFALSESGILLKTENAGGPTLPYVNFEYQTTGCLGDTVVFEHNGYSGNTYQWSVNDSLIAGAADSLVWYFDTPGVYEIALRGTNSDLSNTYSRSVVITPFPDTALPVYPQQDTLCLGDEVVIFIENSQSGIAYTLYQQPDDLPVDTVNSTGGTIWLSGGSTQAGALYTVSAQNLESGCWAALYDTTQISVVPPTEGITYPAVTICPGDTIQLSARAGLVYAWQPAAIVSAPGVQQPLAFPLDTSTLFTVTILPPYCPVFTDSVQISISFPAIPVITLAGDSLYTHPAGAVVYEWYYNEQLVAETAVPVLPLLGEGSYEVISIDSFGCRSESSPVIVVLISVSRPGDGSFKVYPNPGNGRMAFVLTYGNQPKHIRFFDSLGRLLHTAKWSDGTNRLEITLPDTFPDGVYYWQAEGEGWLRRGKGIKK